MNQSPEIQAQPHFLERSRFHYALPLVLFMAVKGFLEWIRHPDQWQKTLFVHGIMVLVAFCLCAYVVWPLRQREKCTGIPYVKFLMAACFLIFAGLSTWMLVKYLHLLDAAIVCGFSILLFLAGAAYSLVTARRRLRERM
jgi:hypothetical protein